MKQLKERWGIRSNFQLIVILIVFSVTGSSAVYVAKPFLNWIGLHPEGYADSWWGPWVYWTLRILVIFPIYQVLLVIFGWLFGQFTFFWYMEQKLLKRMGFGFLWPESDSSRSVDAGKS